MYENGSRDHHNVESASLPLATRGNTCYIYFFSFFWE